MSGRKGIHIILILTVLFTVLLQFSIAEKNTGFQFLKIPIGSRAQGMGNAYTAIASDANGLYYNPAGASFSLRPSVMLYHANWIEDISVENLSVVYPLNYKLSLSGGISFMHLPEMARYELEGGQAVESGTFQVSSLISQIGMSYSLTYDFSLGVNVKYLHEKLDRVAANGFAFDAGFLFKAPIDYLRIGAAVQNVGSKIKYESHKEDLPLTYRVGVAYQFPYNSVTIAMDGVKITGQDWRFYPGMEVEFLNSLTLRTGYEYQREMGSGYSVGAGFKFLDRYKINYVFSPYGILGDTHRAEVILQLGNFLGRSYSKGNSIRKTGKSYSSVSSSFKVKSSKDRLPIPSGLAAIETEETILLTWNSVNLSDIEYNVYVKIPGKTGIVKINKRPLSKSSYKFSPTEQNLNIRFYVSLVHNEEESELSKPFYYKN